ncbi:Hydrolase, alpha/beta fold family protein [Enhygromyxa salina]|uniref:Hydrolase, alpha/beta fold family protein n=2 Tax=Enhygromyxa salina TaxID=215803 RepID=A0A0C1ZVU2_9BACT|nr:Hydrolase, alpha/beta fold family protein [Enhygromyxa salina]
MIGLGLLVGLTGCMDTVNADATASTSSATESSGGSTGVDGSETTGQPACEADGLEVHVEGATGTLEGTLQLPARCSRIAVLIHPGSGPTDRNGNTVGQPGMNDSLALLAEAITELGYPNLRIDKRGVGGSAGALVSESALRFEHYVDDIGVWQQYLRDEGYAVVVLGHSEGALLTLLASGVAGTVGYVSLAGPGRPAGDVLREQLSAQVVGPLLDEALAIIDSLEQGVTVDSVSPELAPLFRPSVQPYLISWFAYDPAAEIAGSHDVLMTLVGGTTDIQVPITELDILAAAQPDAQTCRIEGMNHVLKAATLDPASQEQTYTDPSLPLAPGLVACLEGFLGLVETAVDG